jgi:anti-anti-sigma factor
MSVATHPTELHVRVLDLGEMTVVGLEGQMDRSNSARVREQLHRAVERDSTTIVLDCSLLRSMGRSEVAVLADAYDDIRDHDGRFVIRQLDDSAMELLAEDGMLDEVEIETD